jgi:hypothetical protein
MPFFNAQSSIMESVVCPKSILCSALVITCLLLNAKILAAQEVSRVGQFMTGDELHALMDDGETFGLGGRGYDYKGSVNFGSNGRLSGSVKLANGEIVTFKGDWEIKGNQLCRTWDRESEVCEDWRRQSKKSAIVFVDGRELGRNYWN